MMHREKKHLRPLFFRQYLDQRFLLPLFIHLLHKPCAQPWLFPRAPSLRQPLLQVSLVHLAWHPRISAHRMQGTASKDHQTARWDSAESLRCAPMRTNVPVQLGRIIAFAVRRFTSKERPSKQRGFLPGRPATPTASLPPHPLHKILV